MAFGFGDLVPYDQLPGAVAGKEAQANVSAVNQGAMASAKTREAGDAADTADMSDMLMQAKAPSALILSNLKDAQSINHMPIKAGYADLEAAHSQVMGDSQTKPSPLEEKKIMALADEMAKAKAPKFDPNNPGDWLSKQNPDSNQDMKIAQLQGQIDSRQLIAGNNVELRREKEANLQDYRRTHEDRVDARTGMLAGAGVVPGAAPQKVQTAANALNFKFASSPAGQALASPFGRKGLLRPENAATLQAVVNHYHDLLSLGDMQKATDFYNTNQEFLKGENPPVRAVKNKPQGSRAPNDASETIDAAPDEGGLRQTPTITPLQDDEAAPREAKTVVTVGGKVYGVGDPIMMGKKLYYVTIGDGKRGGFSSTPPKGR